MTGRSAFFGAQMKAGPEQAVTDLNATGGVLGKQLKLEIGDDACDPKQAVAVANQLCGKGVVLVAGHFCSGSSIAASDVYEKENVLQISPASTNPKLTEAGKKNVFRITGRADRQSTVAGNYIADHLAGDKIAVVHDKQAYSKGLADDMKKRLNARGIKETLYETITPGEKDYSALVSKLKQAGIDVLYYELRCLPASAAVDEAHSGAAGTSSTPSIEVEAVLLGCGFQRRSRRSWRRR